MAKHPHPLTVSVVKGVWGTVECVVLGSGKCPAREFLQELKGRHMGIDRPQTNAFARFLPLFHEMAEAGQVRRSRFGPEAEGFYGFKHSFRNQQIRFACFQDGSKWLLTHGFDKPGAQKGRGRWPSTEIDRARKIRDEYYKRKEETKKPK